MIKTNSGFMLLEAVLSVIIVSVCLTLIAQSLLTNFRTGVHFQETIRSLIVMENRLGLLYATNASEDLLASFPQPLEKPYDKFTATTRTDSINDHLKKITLKLNWPSGKAPGRLDLTTIIYFPDASQAAAVRQ